MGYNAAKGEYTDMIAAGILDPLKVVKTALIDASGTTNGSIGWLRKAGFQAPVKRTYECVGEHGDELTVQPSRSLYIVHVPHDTSDDRQV